MTGNEMSLRRQVVLDRELSRAARRASALMQKLTRRIEGLEADQKGDTHHGQGKTGRG